MYKYCQATPPINFRRDAAMFILRALRPRAFNARLCAVWFATALAASASAQTPANDNFISRAALTGGVVNTTGSNISATLEPGEPAHAGNAGGASIWWTWTAPMTAPVTISTNGSNFDTLLGVYTGSSITGLTFVASNDDSSGLTSAVTFGATGGTVYQIAVDGYFGATGAVAMGITQFQVVNDNFAARTVLTGTMVATSGSNIGASKEPGEPNHGGSIGGSSVWWTWTAPSSAVYTITTTGSNFDTVLGVYTGSTVTALGAIASNDDFGGRLTSTVTFNAVIGTIYQIAVDGYANATGSIRLNIGLQQPQSISFPAQTPGTRTFIPGGVFTLNPTASASSGLPITYRSNTTAICIITGTTVTIVAVGTCVLVADQAGNPDYLAAAAVGQTIELTQMIQAAPSLMTGGTAHSCMIDLAGGVKCWGHNVYGSLGNGTVTSSNTPVPVNGLARGITSVSAGFYHTCALTVVGGVKCWGNNRSGELGNNTMVSSSTPVDVVGLTSGVTAMVAGASHTCALTAAGGVKCWGYNAYGGLGNGATTNSLVPVNVAGLTSGIAAIAAGTYHTCALTTGGGAKCWGYNGGGELGNGTYVDSNVPSDVLDLASGSVGITTGLFHSCVQMQAGNVRCWGRNGNGQLGIGSVGGFSNTPLNVVGLSTGIAAISSNGNHSCVLTTASGVKCWGANNYGELGSGNLTTSATPINVSGLTTGAVAIATGDYHSCARLATGGIKCWGNNADGQLGNGTLVSTNSPVKVSGLTTISAGLDNNAAVTPSGAVWSWGRNNSGKLGNGTTIDSAVAVKAVGLDDVIAVSTGHSHTLALTVGGNIWAWGNNARGQLGYDGRNTESRPQRIAGIGNVIAVSAGMMHSMALRSDGTVWTWGDNTEGQLGRTSSPTPFNIPGQVIGLTGIITGIVAGSFHSIARRSDGTLMAWGRGTNGELGNGGTGTAASPTNVSTLTGVVAFSAGFGHTLALKSDGTVWAWGWNRYGQVGNGSGAAPPANQLAPIALAGLTNVAEISAGYSSSMARKRDGTVWTWGLNHDQIAPTSMCGTSNNRPCARVPTQIVGLVGAIAVAGGGAHTITVRPDDSLANVGRNFAGQLGNNTANFGTSRILTDAEIYDPDSVPVPPPPAPCPPGILCKATNQSRGSVGIGSIGIGSSGSVNFRSLSDAVSFAVQLRGTNSIAQELILTNNTTASIAISNIAIDGDFGSTNNCNVLPSNTTCAISLVFAPTIGGLREGTLSFTTNAVDSPSVQITVAGTGVSGPSAPRNVSATAGSGTATFSFSPPEDDGGSPVTSTSVQCVGPDTKSGTGSESPITVTGLAPGATYSCTVTATNMFGVGSPSTAVNITLNAFLVTVAKSGNGNGMVRSTPVGINCGTACSAAYVSDSIITLTATPDAGSILESWAGCDSTNALNCSMGPITSARTITASFAASAITIPSAPTDPTAIAGNAQATISFTASASNGGSAIAVYTVTCNAGSTVATGSGSGSPITVPNLVNNIVYTCSVTATNPAGPSASSPSVNVTPLGTAVMALTGIHSRKSHAGVIYNLPISAPNVNGLPTTVESRMIGTGHRIVFQFNNTVTAIGPVTATAGTVQSAMQGNEVVVTLTSVPNNSRVTVTLIGVSGVNGTADVSAVIGFLVGDVNNTRSVNSSDISGIKARLGQSTNLTNFKFDVNVSGAINSLDLSAVKARSGLMVP